MNSSGENSCCFTLKKGLGYTAIYHNSIKETKLTLISSRVISRINSLKITDVSEIGVPIIRPDDGDKDGPFQPSDMTDSPTLIAAKASDLTLILAFHNYVTAD
jgi:hypothetical protein